jgi:hypothetical protein
MSFVSSSTPSTPQIPMDTFQKSTVIIAARVLIGALTVIGVGLYSARYSKEYPPTIPTCPDYWTYDEDSGECTNPEEGGDPAAYNPGGQSICDKRDWARSHDPPVPWDGITNTTHECGV